MKWIILAFALFMTFIGFFVYKIQSDSRYDNQLVLENYYKYETSINQQQEQIERANNLEHNVVISEQEDAIVVHFPEGFDPTQIKGKISLYRPSDEKLDFEIPISLSSSKLLIPRKVLADGRWDIRVQWDYQGKTYMNVEKLNLH